MGRQLPTQGLQSVIRRKVLRTPATDSAAGGYNRLFTVGPRTACHGLLSGIRQYNCALALHLLTIDWAIVCVQMHSQLFTYKYVYLTDSLIIVVMLLSFLIYSTRCIDSVRNTVNR